MQVDVREYRGDYSALRRSLVAYVELPVLHVAVLEESRDQAQQVRVVYPVPQELQHPGM